MSVIRLKLRKAIKNLGFKKWKRNPIKLSSRVSLKYLNWILLLKNQLNKLLLMGDII